MDGVCWECLQNTQRASQMAQSYDEDAYYTHGGCDTRDSAVPTELHEAVVSLCETTAQLGLCMILPVTTRVPLDESISRHGSVHDFHVRWHRFYPWCVLSHREQSGSVELEMDYDDATHFPVTSDALALACVKPFSFTISAMVPAYDKSRLTVELAGDTLALHARSAFPEVSRFTAKALTPHLAPPGLSDIVAVYLCVTEADLRKARWKAEYHATIRRTDSTTERFVEPSTFYALDDLLEADQRKR